MGYRVLAKLLTQENTFNNLVITTNFDSLVEDSLFLYTDKKPLVAGHESLACYIDSNVQRPVVAKVHRGLMYEPFNSTEDISKLQPEWRDALSLAFSNYTPIVIGYAGGDRSLMAFMEEDSTKMQHGIYWCYRKQSEPPEHILKFVEEKDGCLVAIDGFDALMLTIGDALFKKEITPTGTENCLRERLERRLQNYNEKYAEALRAPQLKEPMQAIDAVQQADEERREKEQELTAQDYIRRGVRAYVAGVYLTAIQEFEYAIEKDHNNADAYSYRGTTYHAIGEYEKAIKDFTKAIELEPEDAYIYSYRGDSYKKLKQYEKAIEDYTKTIEFDPAYEVAYRNRGVLYHNTKQYDKAIEEYSKAIELDPKYAEYYLNRGSSHRLAGNYGIINRYNEDYAKAVQDYTRVIELKPGNALAYIKRADAYRRIDKPALAKADDEAAERLLKYSPNSTPC